MFDFLKSFFSSEDTSAPSAPAIEDSTPVNRGYTYIYIWLTNSNDVGHVAIQAGGTEPLLNNNEPVDNNAAGVYASLHPSIIPAIGPLVALPLPAHLSNSLLEDMEVQDHANHKDFRFDNEDSTLPPIEESVTPYLPPDQTVVIDNLNIEAMQKYILQARNDVDSGKTDYQLFPNVDLKGFLRDLPNCISYDSVDAQLSRQTTAQKENESQVYNCATFTSHVLAVGGLEIKESQVLPWGLSPNSLSEAIADATPSENSIFRSAIQI